MAYSHTKPSNRTEAEGKWAPSPCLSAQGHDYPCFPLCLGRRHRGLDCGGQASRGEQGIL
jgi:hypothetical protein